MYIVANHPQKLELDRNNIIIMYTDKYIILHHSHPGIQQFFLKFEMGNVMHLMECDYYNICIFYLQTFTVYKLQKGLFALLRV